MLKGVDLEVRCWAGTTAGPGGGGGYSGDKGLGLYWSESDKTAGDSDIQSVCDDSALVQSLCERKYVLYSVSHKRTMDSFCSFHLTIYFSL